MAELYPSDTELAALSGTTDDEQEVLFVPTGESPYYLSFYKMLHRLLNVARRSGDLRVYKDGDLTFGVRAGKYLNGDSAVNYAGASAQALTNNQTNYVYLTAAGALTVNITGFPVPSATPHIPLATIVTAGGTYAYTDVTDYRGRGIFSVPGATVERGRLVQDDNAQYSIPLFDFKRVAHLVELPAAGDGTNMGLAAATSGAQELVTTAINNNHVIETVRTLFALPPEYVAGQTVTLRVHVQCPDVNVSATLDAEVYESDREGSCGADLNTTDAQDIDGATYTNKEFNITATNLAPGDVLDITLTIDADDTGGAAGASAEIGAVELLLDIKG